MLRRAFNSILLLCCVWLAVGPLAILQIGAWSWMMLSYSQESSLKQAVSETFSDQRPCGMCKLIDSVEQESKEEIPLLPEKGASEIKLIAGSSQSISLFRPRAVSAGHLEIVSLRLQVPVEVPTPPPRSHA